MSLSGDAFTIGAGEENSSTGKAYTGTVSSVTTLDDGSASRTIDGISFISNDDWIIGQTTSGNQVTLLAGNFAEVTASGKAVYVGMNAGSNHNTLVIAGTLFASQINVGAAGNMGNTLSLSNSTIDGWGMITVASGSTLMGTGTIVGNVTNYGNVKPGNSPGIVNIIGNYTEMGVLTFELNGLTAGTQYDQINVTSQFDAGGSIALVLGFTPVAGNSFQIMTFGSFVDSGYSFDLSQASLTSGLLWDLSDFASTGTVSIVADTSSIPEPASLVMMMIVTAVTLTRRRGV